MKTSELINIRNFLYETDAPHHLTTTLTKEINKKYLKLSDFTSNKKKLYTALINWYINKYNMTQHITNIRLDVEYLSLKDLTQGYIKRNPYENRFDIKMKPNSNIIEEIDTLIHELTHYKQYISGSMKDLQDKTIQFNEISYKLSDTPYEEQP